MEAPSLSTSPTKHKYARVEVFSAWLVCTKPHNFNSIYSGLLLLRSRGYYHLLFESGLLQPPQIILPEMEMQADVPLIDPEYSIPVEDEIFICPWFLDVIFRAMMGEQPTLWRAGSDKINGYICKTFNVAYDTDLEMHFAVYNDAVEAYLDVFLEDLGDADQPVLIHGTVRCRNSFVSDYGASSILFEKGHGDEVRLNPSRSLPLSRRMVVVPCGSVLNVDVRLAIGSKSEDASSAEDTVVFNRSSEHEEDCITIPNSGKVCVKVAWKECTDHV